MRRFNAGVFTLLIIAAYFIATAFIPDLYLAFNYKLILALLFVLLSWQSKGKFLFFLGMAFLSTYIHDLFRLDYSEWTLFVGILILGIAGILNQTAGYILFPYVYKGSDAHAQLGIFGAASKIAMIMSMITQAFRYAYEPFVFGKARDKDNKETYARAMKFFIIFTLLAFLVVMGYMDVLRHIIGRDYWVGLRVVPVVMAGGIMTGVYFNLSFWYKLIDRTIWGAYFSGIGCAVIIGINVVFVPRYGYIACAWAGFLGNATAMVLSYLVGQRKYPIDYPLKSIFTYVLIGGLFFAIIAYSNANLSVPAALGVNTLVIILFIAHIVYHDLPLAQLRRRISK